MSGSTFKDSLPAYERKVWSAHHSAVPLRRRGGEDLCDYHGRMYEELAEVWNWGVELFEQGGAARLKEEAKDLTSELEDFRVEVPNKKEHVPLNTLREDLRRWQCLREEAAERVEEGDGNKVVGPRDEDRYDCVLADTTYEELLESADLAVNERKEALHEGRRLRAMIQLRHQVCQDLIRRARGIDEVEPIEDRASTDRDVSPNVEGHSSKNSSRGRPPRLKEPERVQKTLDVVCEWLDTDPPKKFKGDGGLLDFASDRFVMLQESGIRDRVKETFDRLKEKYSDLPSPDLGKGYSGKKYVKNEETIRQLRDEYTNRFIEKGQ